MKTKFRATVAWKKFRNVKKEEQDGKCYVTGNKLTRSANLHHLLLDPDKYTDLSHPENFIYLSKSYHDTVHLLFGRDGRNWREKYRKLGEILEKMEKLNGVVLH